MESSSNNMAIGFTPIEPLKRRKKLENKSNDSVLTLFSRSILITYG